MKPLSDIDIATNQVKDRRVQMFIKASRRTKVQIMCLAVLISLGLGRRCEATSIVAIRTSKSIVVASDSAGTFRGSHRSHVCPVCKIYQDGKMFFAVSGFVDDPGTHFNVATAIIRASKDGRTIRDRAVASEIVLRANIPAEIVSLKSNDPVGYQSVISGKASEFSAVLFFGIENGIPVTTGFGLMVSIASDGKIEVNSHWESCPGADCPNGMKIYYLGEHEAIDQYRARYDEGQIAGASPKEVVETMVGLEVKQHPDSVQRPIDVLEVSTRGVHWFHRKKECQDQK